MAKDRVTKDLTTGIGTLSFPHLFKETASQKDDGGASYDVQIIIPKSQRDDVREILAAIKEVGEAKWGAKWKQVRNPLRDGDAEADEMTEDGSTKGEKYPERLGCYFFSARSSKPVGVVDRQRNAITEPDEVYGGCKGRISVTFYPYSVSGNHGIGAGLNGVQKVGEGDPLGGGRPSVDEMFDVLDDDEVDDLLDTDEEEEAPQPKKVAAKKKIAAKKAAPKAAPVEDDDEDDLYDDL